MATPRRHRRGCTRPCRFADTVRAADDGSIELRFGPEPPAGFEGNWIRTIPGKGWFTILRLYGPIDGYFDGTWKPTDVRLTRTNASSVG